MLLTLDQIKAARESLPREEVEVPELGGSLYVRVLTLREVDEIRKAQKVSSEPLKLYPRILTLACVDDKGSPIFGPNDGSVIEGLPWPALDRIARAALTLNRMMEGDSDPKEN